MYRNLVSKALFTSEHEILPSRRKDNKQTMESVDSQDHTGARRITVPHPHLEAANRLFVAAAFGALSKELNLTCSGFPRAQDFFFFARHFGCNVKIATCAKTQNKPSATFERSGTSSQTGLLLDLPGAHLLFLIGRSRVLTPTSASSECRLQLW